MRLLIHGMLFVLLMSLTGFAQTSSISKRHAEKPPTDSQAKRESTPYAGNKTYESASLWAVKTPPPKQYKINDLVTVVVRQNMEYEAGGKIDTRKKFELTSELEAFIKFIGGGVGASAFRRGKPNIDYAFEERAKNQSDKDRSDSLTTRITAKIIDVKPNGNLVLEAKAHRKFDDEDTKMTLTGTCRSKDVTADNTVLSTQLADLTIEVKNKGAVHEGSARGWVTKLLDIIRPF